jgi:hypothetical protein
MRRFVTLAIVVIAAVFTLSYVVPAAGGPQALSSASPLKIAKKALKKANKADKRARLALTQLQKKGAFLGTNVQTVSSPAVSIAVGSVGIAAVDCPPGTIVISGGYSLIGPEANVFSDHRSGNGWSVGGDNTAAAQTPGAGPASLTAEAQCVSSGNVVVASRSRQADRRRDRELLAQQRAAALER